MRVGRALAVNLNHLSYNFEQLKKLCPSPEILFMVKADAYGHGLIVVTHFAYHELAINNFGVASLEEAMSLRENLKDDQFEIYVCSDTHFYLEQHREFYSSKRIFPVLSSMCDLDVFLQSSNFKHFPLCLKFNTGMNRLGLKDCAQVIQKCLAAGRRSVYHLMSHFACASSVGNERNTEQSDKFLEIKKLFKDSGIDVERTSLANSGAIEQGLAMAENFVRPGLMLYGPSALERIQDKNEVPKNKWQGRMLSSFKSNIIKVFKANKGDEVGYGATLVRDAGVVVILALGYGDGLSTRFENVQINHRGMLGTFFGRINMDMAQIFFKGKSVSDFKVGEEIEIWNEDMQSFLKLSRQSQIIPYEILCQISSRIPRLYIK